MTSRTGHSTDRRARSVAAWLGVGIVIWLVLMTWALAIGRYGGPDEPAHITRAAAVADGQVRGAPATGMAGGFRVVEVPVALATGDPACYRHDASVPATCSDDTGDGAGANASTGTAKVATSAGINPPLYYALVGLPVRLLGDPADTMWYRIVAAGWTALVLTLALWRMRRLEPIVIVAATITPAAWFLFGVVNPNGLEIALCLLASVSLPECVDDPPTVAACSWVAVPAAVAIAIRPIGVIAAAAIAAVLLVRYRWTRGWPWRSRIAIVAPIAGAAVWVVGWNAWVQLAFDDPRLADPRSRWRVFGASLRGTGTTLREMVGSASWLEWSMPSVSQAAWWTITAVLVLVVWRRASARGRWAMGAWAVVLALGPVAFETVAARRVGLIWQGRYSIPTLAGLAAFVSTLSLRVRAVQALAVGATTIELCAFWATLRRATVGTDGSWWFTGGPHGRWVPPVPALALLIAHVALIGGVVWFVAHRRARNHEGARGYLM